MLCQEISQYFLGRNELREYQKLQFWVVLLALILIEDGEQCFGSCAGTSCLTAPRQIEQKPHFLLLID